MLTVKIIPNDKGNPPGKLAEPAPPILATCSVCNRPLRGARVSAADDIVRAHSMVSGTAVETVYCRPCWHTSGMQDAPSPVF